MLIRAHTSVPHLPVRAGSQGAPDVPTGDRYVPSSEVFKFPQVPSLPARASIDVVAARLHDQWQRRMGDGGRCVVGILCEHGWHPDKPEDAVLNIADAIMDAGGMPRVLYSGGPADQMKGLDALAVPGGRDVDPASYGMERGPGMPATDPEAEPDPDFDSFEIECIRQAYETGMPVLAHCRGEHIMNVAGGGTLLQDIPSEFNSPAGFGSKYGNHVNHRLEAVRHDHTLRIYPTHPIYLEPGSKLQQLVGGSLEAVNSIHHQCIAMVSPLLVPVAWALDGVIEGVERKGMPWQAGYQFHPEALRYTDPKYQQLYDRLVDDGVRFREGELNIPEAGPMPWET